MQLLNIVNRIGELKGAEQSEGEGGDEESDGKGGHQQ